MKGGLQGGTRLQKGCFPEIAKKTVFVSCRNRKLFGDRREPLCCKSFWGWGAGEGTFCKKPLLLTSSPAHSQLYSFNPTPANAGTRTNSTVCFASVMYSSLLTSSMLRKKFSPETKL